MDIVKLEDVCEFEKGATGLAAAESGEFPLVTTGADRKTCRTYQFDTKAVCIPLVSSTGHGHASLKNVHYQEGRFALGTILVALTSKDEDRLNIQFLHLYLSQLKDQVLVPLMSGAANVALSVKKIQKIEIPLPSIRQQREIVQNFKSIVVEESALISELSCQRNILKQLRQKILQDAIEGKLTASWRINNSDVESTVELLRRIATTREQLAEGKSRTNGKLLPANIESKNPFQIPRSWLWTSLANICSKTGSGSTPRGGKSVYLRKGIKFIRSQNVYNKGLVLTDVAYIDNQIHEKMKGTKVQPNDLLLNITGGSIGRCALVPERFDTANINQHVAIIRSVDSRVAAYLHKVIISDYFQKCVLDAQTGAGREGLPKNKMDQLLVPMPPIDEQKAIVQKIESLFKYCDELETQIIESQIHAEQLMKVVLKEAFTPKHEKSGATDNVLELKPSNSKQIDYYKRNLLAAEIVDQLRHEPTLGKLKLQKLIFLCQKTQQMELATNFLQQAAGPYDPQMARSLDKQFKDKKWFAYKKNELKKYQPLENVGSHKQDYQKFFVNEEAGVSYIINLFRKSRSEEMEAVATLYACWEAILDSGQSYSVDRLIERFYDWSDEKVKFSKEQLIKYVGWMKDKNIYPENTRHE